VVNLANALRTSERPENVARALEILEHVYAARVRTLGKEHEATSRAGEHLAKVLMDFDREAEAEPLLRERLVFLRRLYGNDERLRARDDLSSGDGNCC
jgi:hypothetical protein